MQSSKIQTFTFNDMGRKFYVAKNVMNVFCSEWHQSEELQLKRINQQTIKGAFDPKIPQVTYQLTQISQNQLNLKFIVKLQFLATQFSEDIVLNKIQMDKKQEKQLQLNQIHSQINKITKLIEQKQNVKNLITINEKQNFNGINCNLWQLNLKAGKYFVQMTGDYLIYPNQNHNYDDDYYGGQNYLNQLIDTPLEIHLIVDTKQTQKLKAPTPHNFSDGYPYPYYFSTIIQLTKDSEVKVYVTANTHDPLNMTNNIISIQPLSANQFI